jgi:pimeloyl-ACP methyl ester carboxylesterase
LLFKGFFAEWKEEWQIFPSVHYRWTLGAESDLLARTAAHTYTMAYEQPVLYELASIQAPALFVVGDKDRTALGRNRVSAETRAKMGNMPELAKKAAASMQNGKATIFPDVSHVPHLEATERFHEEIIQFIESK